VEGAEIKAGPDPLNVLVVDDNEFVRRAATRALELDGFRVTSASDGSAALDLLTEGGFDAILSDIQMPGMDGIEFLRAVRERDGDVAVVLMTGEPTLESAIRAVEYGATQYLVKPLDAKTLRAVLRRAVQLGALARAKRRALAVVGGDDGPGDLASLDVLLDRALATMWPGFQPIVRWPEREIYAYEALMRTREPGFKGPQDVLDAAERLGRVYDVGRAMRRHIAAAAISLRPGALLFVNLHPRDLADEDLYDPAAPLTPFAPRVVLEITERASLDGLGDVPARMRRLRSLGFRVAVDDLGAGYAGLTSVLQLEPEVVKLDMSLVRGIDADSSRQQVVRSLVQLCLDLGMRVVAEGVETASERDMLASIGCELLQGYWFAKPGPAWPEMRKD
jgi:EAL domain-containing protein (putative c-di-GMP-specific phosphodiesterase class I)